MIAAIPLTADDDGLKNGMILGLLIMMMGAGFSAKYAVELGWANRGKKLETVLAMLMGVGFVCIGGYIALNEHSLLTNYVYVEGTILREERCGKAGIGVEFEYAFQGQRYTSCNTYGGATGVLIPGGRYYVRVSDFDPSVGRMDFEKPVEEN